MLTVLTSNDHTRLSLVFDQRASLHNLLVWSSGEHMHVDRNRFDVVSVSRALVSFDDIAPNCGSNEGSDDDDAEDQDSKDDQDFFQANHLMSYGAPEKGKPTETKYGGRRATR